jgi:anti-anti-sigma factor
VLPGFRLTVIGEHPVLAPTGELDLAGLPRWHDALTRAVEQHRGVTLLIDLDGVGSIDDLAVGVLLSAGARARDRGGRIELVAANPVLRDRLARLGVDRVLPVRTSIGG